MASEIGFADQYALGHTAEFTNNTKINRFNPGILISKLLIFINSKNLRTIRKLIACKNFQDYSISTDLSHHGATTPLNPKKRDDSTSSGSVKLSMAPLHRQLVFSATVGMGRAASFECNPQAGSAGRRKTQGGLFTSCHTDKNTCVFFTSAVVHNGTLWLSHQEDQVHFPASNSAGTG